MYDQKGCGFKHKIEGGVAIATRNDQVARWHLKKAFYGNT